MAKLKEKGKELFSGMKTLDETKEKKWLSTIKRETGFSQEEQIYVGEGDVVYKGVYRGRPSILKIFNLERKDEYDTIMAFNAQNKSKITSSPEIFHNKPFTQKQGYGFFISEFIDAPNIVTRPFPTPEELEGFAVFYQDFRTRAVTRNFLPRTEDNLLPKMIARVAGWRKMNRYVSEEDYAPRLATYYEALAEYYPKAQIVFQYATMHTDHLFRSPEGKFKLIDYHHFGYTFLYTDASMMVWHCWGMMKKSPEYKLDDYLKVRADWMKALKSTTLVKQDKQFGRNFAISLMERSIGTLLADVGGSDFYKDKKDLLKQVVGIHQHLFDMAFREFQRGK